MAARKPLRQYFARLGGCAHLQVFTVTSPARGDEVICLACRQVRVVEFLYSGGRGRRRCNQTALRREFPPRLCCSLIEGHDGEDHHDEPLGVKFRAASPRLVSGSAGLTRRTA